MTKRRDVLTFGLGFLTAATLARGRAVAQSQYPERAIKLVVPFAPGGVIDVVGRLWANEMKTLIGPVFIENQSGGGGSVGSAAVARAQPDGYTILLGSAGSQVLMTAAGARAPSHALFDPANDLQPIAILGVTALAIAVNPAVPARNLQELVDYAKANPGKLSYGSAGAGTMTHLTGELFKSLTGTSGIVHVPYKGAGQAITDLISGHLPMLVLNVTSQVVEWHQSGKLRMLAVTAPARVSAAPDVPTAVESGLPGMISQNFIGLFAPAGTATAIVAQISQATRRAMADGEFRHKLIAASFEPLLDSTPETAQRFVADEIGRWTPVIRTIGLNLE